MSGLPIPEELSAPRRYARWWDRLPADVRALEGASLREDRTIRRLSSEEIDRNPDLRSFAEMEGVEPADLLSYMAHAEGAFGRYRLRSEEHTSELQSRVDLVCRLLLAKKKRRCL